MLGRERGAAGDAEDLDEVGKEFRGRTEVGDHRGLDVVTMRHHHAGQRHEPTAPGFDVRERVGAERGALNGVQAMKFGDRGAVVEVCVNFRRDKGFHAVLLMSEDGVVPAPVVRT